MLTVGDKFPDFSVQGVVSTDPANAFQAFSQDSDKGKWKLVFFWPKDFTFVCPTEIAGFGKLKGDFADRDTVIYGVSTDSEFVHLAWRQNHADLKTLPFAMLADTNRRLSTALGILDEEAGVAKRATFLVDPGRHHPLRLCHRHERGPQSGRSAAGAGCAADRRALPLQLAEGRRGHQDGRVDSTTSSSLPLAAGRLPLPSSLDSSG